MSSFGILKTNVGLTSNIKVMIGAKSDMYLDSIESDSELSRTKYKKVKFNKDSKYDSLVPYFYDKLPSSIAFKIKYDNDVNIMYDNFKYQYDDTYIMGARNITNKNYDYDYEYFAPLFIDTNNIPKEFIVFRLDGQGIFNSNKDNFKTEILNKLKCVTHFNLTTESNLGKWIDTSFVSNPSFPNESLFFDFRDGYFTQWSGINYLVGGYTTMSSMLNETLYYSNGFHEMEKLVLDGFKNNNLIYPNIINFSFMFNDTPATKSSLRKWSINRYLGFYINDTILHKYVTPYNNIKLNSDISIINDNILSLNGVTKNINPFVTDFKKYNKYYLEIDGVFYEIIKKESVEPTSSINKTNISNNNIVEVNKPLNYFEWKVISNIDLSGKTYNDINKSNIVITETNIISYTDNSPIIDELTYNEKDLWIIEIDGKYHRINGEYQDNIFINVLITDYGFEISDTKFKYYINLTDPSYTTTIDLTNPITFKVFSCDFSDIKELDSNIIETDYSRFELDITNEFNETQEPKLYVEDYNSNTHPLNVDEYKYGSEIINIPCSSEYTASGEMYQIDNNTLNTVWRKNSIGLKWGYKNSLSSYDYPYLLNNSLIGDDSNRTVNLNTNYISQYDRTLDYFYTFNDNVNNKYNFQTLMIYKPFNELSIGFNYNRYFSDENYFDYLFDNYIFDKDGNKFVTKKYSLFNNGDNIITNTSLFRGIKFNLYKVNNIGYYNGNLSEISTSSTSDFDGYKFSIIATKNALTLKRNANDISILDSIEPNNNQFDWIRVKEFDFESIFMTGDVFLYDDILYQYVGPDNMDYSLDVEFDIDFVKYPNLFTFYNKETIYYNPNKTYVYDTDGRYDIIIHDGEYYYHDGFNNSTNCYKIWTRNYTYSLNEFVFYKGIVYLNIKPGNTLSNISPDMDVENFKNNPNTYVPTWQVSNNVYSEIKPINLEGTTDDIEPNFYIRDGVIYRKNINGIYSQYYNIEGNNNIYYSYDNTLCYKNNLIRFNNILYINSQDINEQGSRLDNGIDILINFKHKNIVLNIYCNDNTYTLEELSNLRDKMYKDIFSKLNASNICLAINNLSDIYGFANGIRYIIIDDNIRIYSLENITELPYLLQCDTTADIVTVRTESKIYKPYNIPETILKPTKILDKGLLPDFGFKEYFNFNLPVGVEITTNKSPIKSFSSYHGISDNNNSYIFRYSGPYEPIFNEIDLFEVNPNGNFKFDTSLFNFGMTSERIISKVNLEENILKLKNTKNYKSIFPLYDEFGYTVVKSYIFKSTWDTQYYIECKKNI